MLNKYKVTYIDEHGFFHDIIASARSEEGAKGRIAALGKNKWRVLSAICVCGEGI